jgi:hypothetical protein
MKALMFVIMLCVCVCNIASAQQFPQGYYGAAAAGSGPTVAYPPYYPPPVYPQPAPQMPFYPGMLDGGGGGGSGRTYESALISLLAIQNVLTQQTEVQRGWNDRANDKLNILLNQQEFYRQTYGRDQQELMRQLCGLQHIQPHFPYPQPRPYPIPQPRRRGLFRGGAGANIAVGGDAYYGY